jgi:exodeoxyribonuclease VII small subunit
MPKIRQSPSPAENLSFEQAMEELDGIVHLLEDSQLPLDELVERYERGTSLLKICQEKLDAAQQRIEIIARGPSGRPETQPLAQTAPETSASRPETAAAPDSSDDEIRLF